MLNKCRQLVIGVYSMPITNWRHVRRDRSRPVRDAPITNWRHVTCEQVATCPCRDCQHAVVIHGFQLRADKSRLIPT